MNIDRFKLRFWNPTKKRMMECYIEWDLDYQIFAIHHVNSNFRPIYCTEEEFKDCVIVQCTGLHDSEGTLIWEHDVVEYGTNDGHKHLALIEWDEHNACFLVRGDHDFDMDTAKSMKIVGNKYEHSSYAKL